MPEPTLHAEPESVLMTGNLPESGYIAESHLMPESSLGSAGSESMTVIPESAEIPHSQSAAAAARAQAAQRSDALSTSAGRKGGGNLPFLVIGVIVLVVAGGLVWHFMQPAPAPAPAVAVAAPAAKPAVDPALLRQREHEIEGLKEELRTSDAQLSNLQSSNSDLQQTMASIAREADARVAAVQQQMQKLTEQGADEGNGSQPIDAARQRRLQRTFGWHVVAARNGIAWLRDDHAHHLVVRTGDEVPDLGQVKRIDDRQWLVEAGRWLIR